MPDAQRIAENKAKSEARRIILGLRMHGMKNAEIATAVGVEPSKIQRIVAGDMAGDDVLAPLSQVVTAYAAPAQARSLVQDAVNGTASASHGARATATAAAPLGTTAPVRSGTAGGASPLPPSVTAEAPAADPDAKPSMLASIKAAMLGNGAPEVTAPKGKGTGAKAGEKGVSLAEQVTPMAALLVVLVSNAAIPDPYKSVAPTDLEAAAMVGIPIRWLLTDLDVAGHLSDRALEVVALLLAVTLYGNRAVDTWKTIHAAQPKREAAPVRPPIVAAQPAPAAAAQNGHAQPGAAPNPLAAIYGQMYRPLPGGGNQNGR